VGQQLREKMDKWDCTNSKTFFIANQIVTRLKREPTEWERIFASYSSDKGLLARLYRKLKN
jgi:hypothetical protein